MKNKVIPEGIYSKDVEEILSRKPSRIVRYGIPLIAFAFLLFLLISYFIPYPEKANFPATTTLTFIPESLSIETAYCAIPYRPEYSELFREGNIVNLLPVTKTKENPPVMAQVTGVISDLQTGERMVVFRMSREEQVLLFNNFQSAEIKIITGNSNLLSRIFNPVIRLFRDPLSQMEQKQT